MNQGEAISVLIRAHELTNEPDYLQTAMAAALAYQYEYGHKGIQKQWKQTGINWFQEAGQFILNGHNYALWGLWELYNYTHEEAVQKLFLKGIHSLEQSLPLFDGEYWSLYRLDSPPYMASIMYHNLHIVQLQHLAEVTQSSVLNHYSQLFTSYASRPINRMKSLLFLFKSKFL